MPDREKIIRAVDSCFDYWLDKNRYLHPLELENVRQLKDDALAMLKEQEAKEGHWIVLEFCANEGIYCSECHMKIFDRTTKPKKKLSQYCPHCGSRNEQFFRDGEVVFR